MLHATSAPARAAPLKRKIAAILAADVAGYSRLVADDEEGTVRALAAARAVFDRLVSEAGGRVFNTAGDSVMCEFDSAVEAVRVAIAVQRAVTDLGATVEPARRLAFRMGLTIGDVVEQDGDLLGDGVNLAARLESLAPVGGLCISRSMHEAVVNKVEGTFRPIGEKRVKNMPNAVGAWVLDAPPAPPAPAPRAFEGPAGLTAEPRSPAASAGRRPSRLPAVAAALVAAGGLGWAAWHGRASSPERPPANLAVSEPRVPAPTPSPEPALPADLAPAPTRPPARTAAPAKPDAAVKSEAPARPSTAAPASLREGYEAARALETKGDRPGAIAAYAALAPLARDQVDPFLRDATLLRQRGSADAARRALDEVAKASGARGAALVAAAQGDPAAAIGRLETFASANPDYPPADYLLGEAYLARPGGPTLTERRLAYDSFDRFVESGDRIGGYFLDAAIGAGWLDAARKRRAEIEIAFAGSASRPRVGFGRTEAGWTIRVTLPEPATRATLRVGEQGPPRSIAVAAAASGPGHLFEAALPPETGRTTLYVAYQDASGREAGPFPLPFDPEAARVSAARDTLERFPESWVAFRPDLPDLLSYAQLAANRCGISTAMIGFGDARPTERLPLAACDGRGAASPDTRPLLTLPPGTDSVQVQIAYADGTTSSVRTFRRP